MNAMDNPAIPLKTRLALADAALAYANALVQTAHIAKLAQQMLIDGICDFAEADQMRSETLSTQAAAASVLARLAQESSTHVIPE